MENKTEHKTMKHTETQNIDIKQQNNQTSTQTPERSQTQKVNNKQMQHASIKTTQIVMAFPQVSSDWKRSSELYMHAKQHSKARV